MNKRFRHYDQSQSFLLPPSLEDWLPEDHEARFISDVVDDMLDLSVIYDSYTEAVGAPPYDPQDDVQAAALRLFDRGDELTGDGAALPCRRGLPLVECEHGPGLPLDLALSASPPRRHRRPVRPGARAVCRGGAGAARPRRPRRHQAAGVGE